MKEKKIEARRQHRNPSIVPSMYAQTIGAFNIIGTISALLCSSIFMSKALRLRVPGNGAQHLQSSAWKKGHLKLSPDRKVQPLKSQGSCETDMRGMGKA